MLDKEILEIVHNRYILWTKLHEPVTAEHIEAFMLVGPEIDPIVHERRYQEDELRLKEYIVMFRLFHFLFHCWFLDERQQVGWFKAQVDYAGWTQELFERQAFRDVYHRMKRYYPDFQLYLEDIFNQTEHRKQQEVLLAAYLTDAGEPEAPWSQLEELAPCFQELKALGEGQRAGSPLRLQCFEEMDRYCEFFMEPAEDQTSP